MVAQKRSFYYQGLLENINIYRLKIIFFIYFLYNWDCISYKMKWFQWKILHLFKHFYLKFPSHCTDVNTFKLIEFL